MQLVFKIPDGIFLSIEKVIIIFLWLCKTSRTHKIMLQKNKTGEFQDGG
jgi:hypothetical protein